MDEEVFKLAYQRYEKHNRLSKNKDTKKTKSNLEYESVNSTEEDSFFRYSLKEKRKDLKKSLKKMKFDVCELTDDVMVDKANKEQGINLFLEYLLMLRNVEKYVQSDYPSPIWIFSAKPIRNEEIILRTEEKDGKKEMKKEMKKENINKNMFADLGKLEKGLSTINLIEHFYINEHPTSSIHENKFIINKKHENIENDLIYHFNFINELVNLNNGKIKSLNEIGEFLGLIESNLKSRQSDVDKYYNTTFVIYEMSKLIFFKIKKLILNNSENFDEKVKKFRKETIKLKKYIEEDETKEANRIYEIMKKLHEDREYQKKNIDKIKDNFFKYGIDYQRYGDYILKCLEEEGVVNSSKGKLKSETKLNLINSLEKDIVQDQLERKMVQLCSYSEFLSEIKNIIKIYKEIEKAIKLEENVKEDFLNLLRSFDINEEEKKEKYNYRDYLIGKKKFSYYLKKASERRELQYTDTIKTPHNIYMTIDKRRHSVQREIYNKNHEKKEALIYIVGVLLKDILDKKGENSFNNLIEILDTYYNILLENKEIWKYNMVAVNFFIKTDKAISNIMI